MSNEILQQPTPKEHVDGLVSNALQALNDFLSLVNTLYVALVSETTCLFVIMSPSVEIIKPLPIFWLIFWVVPGTCCGGPNGLNGSIWSVSLVWVVLFIPTVTTDGNESSTTFVITDSS